MSLGRFLRYLSGSTLLGTLTIRLFANSKTRELHVATKYVEAQGGETAPIPRDTLAIRAWLLFLEAEIGKLPGDVRRSTVQILEEQCGLMMRYPGLWIETTNVRSAHWQPPAQERSFDKSVVTVDLLEGRRQFATVDYKGRRNPVAVMQAAMVNSLFGLGLQLEPEALQYMGCLMLYGLGQWERNPVGVMSAGRHTWDFPWFDQARGEGKLPYQKESLAEEDGLDLAPEDDTEEEEIDELDEETDEDADDEDAVVSFTREIAADPDNAELYVKRAMGYYAHWNNEHKIQDRLNGLADAYRALDLKAEFTVHELALVMIKIFSKDEEEASGPARRTT